MQTTIWQLRTNVANKIIITNKVIANKAVTMKIPFAGKVLQKLA